MATETTAAGICLNEHGSALGMPQICADWMPNLVFWVVVALVLTFLILSRIALPRIGAVLAERQGTITNDLAAAEELKLKAQEAERAYEAALVQAKADANRIVAEAKAAIQRELDEAMAQADTTIAAKAAQSEARIAEIRAGALEAVSVVAKDTAAELVSALGGSADAASVEAAVNAQLKG